MSEFLDDDDDELLEIFVEEALEGLDSLEPMLINLESNPDDEEAVAALFRTLHSLKGNASFFGFQEVKTLAHDLEDALDDVRQGVSNVTAELVDVLLAGTDMLRGMVDRLSRKEEACPDRNSFLAFLSRVAGAIEAARADDAGVQLAQSVDRLLSFLDLEGESFSEGTQGAICALREVRGRVAQQVSCPAPDAEGQVDEGTNAPDVATNSDQASDRVADSSPNETGHARTAKSMRVPEEKVDIFMRYVGELIISSEAFRHFERELRQSDVSRTTLRRFARVLDGFDALSAELQKSILDIRQVAASGLLRRVPRLVRDMASALGKEINVELIGGDLMIDKSIVEALDAPLTHMIRNSCDHGLEGPERRAAAGKKAQGHLRVEARVEGDAVELVIEDDGAGIDTEAIKKKAVENGVVSSGDARAMSHDQALNLIFGSGVSTAKEVTDISGRGVGMDVVRSHLKELGGTIRITSVLGQGTKLIISLPADFTRVVLQCLVVRVGSDTLCIPIEEVNGIHHFKDAQAHHAAFGEFITVRGDEHLVIRLDELLNDALIESRGALNEGVHILVVDGQSRATLFVDEVLGQQNVVVREMPPIEMRADLFSGIALFGSGSLGLVLAPRAAVRLVGTAQPGVAA